MIKLISLMVLAICELGGMPLVSHARAIRRDLLQWLCHFRLAVRVMSWRVS